MEIRLREENEIGGADVPPAMVNWSNLPLEMIERIIIIGRLDWLDRIRLRAVCKAWSVSSPHIPTVDKFPWALSSYFMKVKNLTAYNYDLIYPPLHLPLLPPFRVPYFHINARAYGSSYGLDATSPKCVIFGLRIKGKKISIYICSPGDIAWKTYDFVLGTVYKNWAWRTARSPNNIWIESPSRAIWSANDLMTAP
ncbi:F-box protein [Corchorus olitorius]|uniref:F-box protein n=1 Tax=Corchorus olitorius TaxID=93759 RepID=A0A1R3JPM9_9ROSI|nr:F-box protein [Corchorus olitorius]